MLSEEAVMTDVSILSLATAVPPHKLRQADIEARARRIFAPAIARFPQLADVFANTGIEERYSVRPIEWFDAPHDFAERSEVYLAGAGELFVEAAQAALEKASLRARDVDVIVTLSSTGIATPSLEARVADRIGFRPDAARIPVFGLGCAGGVSGLAIAARLARASPGAVVLVVVVELCTLAFRADRGFKEDIIATALFGDGAAAIVLRAGDSDAAIRLGAAAEHRFPGTLDIMGWSTDPVGFGVVLSRALPQFLEKNLREPARAFLERAGAATDPAFICHPGGAKVLPAVELALNLPEGTQHHEREILKRYANMSAPSVLFVLARALDAGLRGPAVMCALGPGFTASFQAIEVLGAA
jgi:alkylresorcinol/alkylpyrone synthase